MVLGFICEGQTERKIINSFRFQSLLRSLNITFLKVINTKGNGKLLYQFNFTIRYIFISLSYGKGI